MFDTVNHSILLRKLERYGICSTPLQYISSYLRDRQQTVRIGDVQSELKTTNISVPQGSIMGPLLFLIYINEIPHLSDKFIPTMFADDCTLTFMDNDVNNLIQICNLELEKFKSYVLMAID